MKIVNYCVPGCLLPLRKQKYLFSRNKTNLGDRGGPLWFFELRIDQINNLNS